MQTLLPEEELESLSFEQYSIDYKNNSPIQESSFPLIPLISTALPTYPRPSLSPSTTKTFIRANSGSFKAPPQVKGLDLTQSSRGSSRYQSRATAPPLASASMDKTYSAGSRSGTGSGSGKGNGMERSYSANTASLEEVSRHLYPVRERASPAITSKGNLKLTPLLLLLLFFLEIGSRTKPKSSSLATSSHPIRQRLPNSAHDADDDGSPRHGDRTRKHPRSFFFEFCRQDSGGRARCFVSRVHGRRSEAPSASSRRDWTH